MFHHPGKYRRRGYLWGFRENLLLFDCLWCIKLTGFVWVKGTKRKQKGLTGRIKQVIKGTERNIKRGMET